MPELTCTVEDVLSWDPCDPYNEARLRDLAGGKERMTALEILDLPIPTQDAFWVVLRPELIPERTLRCFACDCAEHVLPLYEAKHPGDDRPRRAIDVARRYADGQATREELTAARAASLHRVSLSR